nr:unnamed protein product [Callosobruchus analis]
MFTVANSTTFQMQKRRCKRRKCFIQEADLNANQDKLRELKVQHELHLRRANLFQDELKRVFKEKDPNALTICFEFQNNMAVPVTNVKDEYYLGQLWIHNLKIKILATSETAVYMYAEHFA